MKRIKEFISRLQPQSRIQNLLEELVEVILADVSITKVGISLYLLSANTVQAEVVKRDNGEIVKTFRMMAGKEILGKIEDGMSTIEIVNKNEVLGRIYLWRDKADKTWDFRFLAPYLEVVGLVLRKARIEWEQKEAFEKIDDMLGEEVKDQRKREHDEGVNKKPNPQVMREQKNLQEREKGFLSLFKMSEDGLFIIDSEGRYLDVNKAACELLGYSKDQILCMNAFGQNIDGAGVCWKVGLGAERCEIVNPQGKMIAVEVFLAPFRYQGKDCFLGTMRGVTIGGEPEKRFEDQRERLPGNGDGEKDELSLTLFDNFNDAVLVMDEDGIILYSNRKAEDIFGYSKGEIVGKSLTRLMPERYREFQFSTLHRLIEGEEPGIMGELVEAEGLRMDGEEFPLEFSISPLPKNGRKQFLSIIRDVSNK